MMRLFTIALAASFSTRGDAQGDECAATRMTPCQSQCSACADSASCYQLFINFDSDMTGSRAACAATSTCMDLACCLGLVDDPADSMCASIPTTSGARGTIDEVSATVSRMFGATYVLDAVEGIKDQKVKSSIRTLLAAECEDVLCMQELWDALHDLHCAWSNPRGEVVYNAELSAGRPHVSLADYSGRGEMNCQAPFSELDWLIKCLLIGVLVMGCWCAGSCVVGKRAPPEITAGMAKVPMNIAGTMFARMITYTVKQDDDDFFTERIPNLPGPADAATNIFQYMAWRRRALYALFPMTFILWLNAIYVAWPTVEDLISLYECHPGDSLLACGGTGSLYQFLMASDAAPGLLRYQVFMVSVTIAIVGFQFVAMRMAAVRAGEWQRSRHWVFLGWFVPFAFVYCEFFFPNERLFMVDYGSVSDQAVMMPYFSRDPASSKFNLCTATHTCAAEIDMRHLVLEQVCDKFIDDPDCQGATVDTISIFMRGHQYDSQASPGAMTIRLGDTGEFYVKEMTDLTDFFVAFFGGGDFGMISESARTLLDVFAIFLRGLVRSKTAFACLSALAPLALSLLPALQKAAFCAKSIFPQDPYVGWIVRAVPLLAVPLHAVFILLIGQMFADWFICLACLCLMVALSAVTIFGAGIVPPTADATEPDSAFTSAKRKGILFNILALLFLVAAIATNETLMEILPKLSLSSDEPVEFDQVARLVHWILIFLCKFHVTKIQVTIMGADFILSMMFQITEDLENKELQVPYRTEAKQASDGMNREWQEGDPPLSGFCFDLFGGESAAEKNTGGGEEYGGGVSSDGEGDDRGKIENPMDSRDDE